MENPDVYMLAQIDWQFFGTLTFEQERLAERVRLGMYFAMLRQTAAKFRVYFPQLPWCLRMENGERFGRRHMHFLIAGLPRHAGNLDTCLFLSSAWEKVGGGLSRITVFDHTLNGGAYISKCLQPNSEDAFTSSRFDGGISDLMLSHGAMKILRARADETERRLAH